MQAVVLCAASTMQAVVLCAASTLSACTPDAPRLESARRPARIVSLHPAASEILTVLGIDDLIVGRALDDRTPELAGRPVVGPTLRPDPERVRALDPTHVLVAAGWGPPLAETGEHAPTLVELPLDRLDDVGPAIGTLGRLFDRRAEAEALVARIRRDFAALPAWEPRCSAPSVLWAVGSVPPVGAGRGSLPDDLLVAVGATNVLADAGTPWPRPALEALAARDPDVVVWPTGPELGPPASVAPSSPWRRLAAFRDGRVAVVDGDLVHRAGPRVGQAARHLFNALMRASCDGAATPTRGADS